ncbi:MAG: hypothetical protein OXU69_14835 [Gemmatimonadota bacterium]|nr:hypothetical protein [Gemmatimonadota bacterium]MDE2985977.1 hypothetical protein [Gemmatimonadota bacterium]
MYNTCIHCNKPLGSNEVVEAFPIGRRLAFDSEKGRLWVVCRKCQRWNLTPLEERWEAVEACERLFRQTPMRASTENIGIARHGEGLDLVRIGKPSRGEFAAWRYGDQLGTRMRKQLLWAGTMGGCVLVGASGVLPLSVVAGSAIAIGAYPVLAWEYLRPVVKVRLEGVSDGGAVAPSQVAGFSRHSLRSVRLLPDDDEPGFGIEVSKGSRRARFPGEGARRVAAALLPHINGWGGSRQSVQRAVGEIEAEGHPGRFVSHVARLGYRNWRGRSGNIASFPLSTRLALEMALHEEQERRALEGELRILEQAWREAEEIAAIADNLLLPAGADAFFDRHGKQG